MNVYIGAKRFKLNFDAAARRSIYIVRALTSDACLF
jgi:hypothetical protein